MILKVFNNDELLDEYENVMDSNIDGTLRIHHGFYTIGEYPPGEWTHIEIDDGSNT